MQSLVTILLCSLFFLTITPSQGQDLLADNHTLKLTKIAPNKKYGYSHKKPVNLGGFNGHVKASQFFAALRGPNGEPIKYRRMGSCCHFKTPNALIGDKGVLDKYSVYYGGLAEPITLYINEYDYEKPLCPKGFTFKTAEEVQVIPILDPALIKSVEACKEEKPYAVDDFLLLEELEYEKGEQIPTTAPIPKEGEEALKTYFADKSLTDEAAAGIMFRVQIGFLVNCKGEAGGYFISSKGKGRLEKLANQILELVNDMELEWLPAEKDGEVVDCYQVLNFSVKGGALEQVSIRK